MEPDDIGRIVSAADPKVSPDGRRSPTSSAGSTWRRTATAAPSGWPRPTAPRRRTSSPRASTATAARVVAGRAPAGVHQPAAADRRAAQGHAARRAGRRSRARSSRSAERDEGFGELALVARTAPPRVHLAGATTATRRATTTARPPRKIDRLFSRLDSDGWTIDRPQQHLRGAGRRLRRAAARRQAARTRTAARRGRRTARRSRRVRPPRGLGPRPGERHLRGRRRRAGGDDGEVPEPTRLTAPTALVDPSWSARRRAHRRAHLRHARRRARSATSRVVDVATGEHTRAHRGARPHSASRTRAPAPRSGHGDAPAVLDRGPRRGARVPRAVAGGRRPQVLVGRRRGRSSGFDLVGGTLAFVADHADARCRSSSCATPDGERAAAQHVGAAFHAAVPSRPPERFTVRAPTAPARSTPGSCARRTSTADGDDVPVAAVNVHGGPQTQYGRHWFDEFQLWASAGYVVVYSNPRGSTGHDEAWARCDPLADAPRSTRAAGWGGVDARRPDAPWSTPRWSGTRRSTPTASACSAAPTAAT